MDIHEASYGGRHGKDGLDAVDTLYANTRNNPIEDIESHLPLRVTQYELLEDRAAARGVARRARDRARDRVPRRGRLLARGRRIGVGAAWVVRRPGRDARGGVLNRGQHDEHELPSKFPYRKAEAGDRLCLISPCGGGYGDPLERDRDAIDADIADGYISLDSARSTYRVI